MRDTTIILPARLNSGRVPRKLLQIINGETLLSRVWRACDKAGKQINAKVIVGVDSDELALECEDIGARWVMTPDCSNGSERVAKVAESLGYTNGDWIINIQADHADITPEAIVEFYHTLEYSHESYHTLYCGWEPLEDDRDGIVKVLVNNHNQALYFTRNPLKCAKKHSGIYGYTGAFLMRYLSWGVSEMEQAESLEQMRVLENGCNVSCVRLYESTGLSINTPEDLKKIAC